MSSDEIEILVNGQPRMARIGQAVSELLSELELDGRLVVVELNRQILRRGELSEVKLEPGDRRGIGQLRRRRVSDDDDPRRKSARAYGTSL